MHTKKTPRYPRRQLRSAKIGSNTHPKTVATESSIVASEIRRVTFTPGIFFRLTISVIAAGTYTDPPHKPIIETSTYNEFTIARLRNSGRNSHPSLRKTHTVRSSPALLSHTFASFTQ